MRFPSVYSADIEYGISDTSAKDLPPITFSTRAHGPSPFSFQDYLTPAQARQLADTLSQAADRVDGGDR